MQVNNSSATAYTLTKKAKIIKAALSAALPLVYYGLCYFLGVSSILWILPLTFIMGIAYTVPLFINVKKIKNSNYLSVKPFILSDLLYWILPSVSSTFALALGLYLFIEGFELVFMFAIILSVLFIIVNLYFWLSYYINNTVIKRIFKDI